MGMDEEGTLAQIAALGRTLLDPKGYTSELILS
jgi:hypothetical protein